MHEHYYLPTMQPCGRYIGIFGRLALTDTTYITLLKPKSDSDSPMGSDAMGTMLCKSYKHPTPAKCTGFHFPPKAQQLIACAICSKLRDLALSYESLSRIFRDRDAVGFLLHVNEDVTNDLNGLKFEHDPFSYFYWRLQQLARRFRHTPNYAGAFDCDIQVKTFIHF